MGRRINEREITFFKDGHNHDGENSAFIAPQPQSIEVEHLAEELVGILFPPDTGDVITDLVIETEAIMPGAEATGTVSWVNEAVVRFFRVLMSEETECTVTCYHLPTYEEEDKEFKAINCVNRFMWEGVWAHYDEDALNMFYYKVENTGLNTAAFQLTFKASNA